MLGLVSFPLLTRSLSVEEYGLLGLVTATVTIFVSFAKLGLQSSMLRFYSEAKTQGSEALKHLLNNVAGAVCVLAMIGAVLWLLYAHFVVPLINDSALPYKRLFLIGTALVPIKIAHSLLANLLQADQQSGILSTITVSEKFFRLVCLVAIVITIGLSSERALILIIISELIFLVVIFYHCRHYLTEISPRLQYATLAPLVAFGAPAMMGELTAVLLETGDRYVIQAYLGGEPLGQYAAAVNICMYLEWVLILALQSAIVPHYVKLYEESGREKTIEFLNGAFNLYVAVAVGVFAVFCVAAPQLVLFLAGEKYRDGLIVIPWFAAGYMLVGAISIAAAGVFIDKRTVLLVKWTVIAFVINMMLNLVAIPRYGLIAAAMATFIAMCIRSIGVYYDASKTLPVAVPWRTTAQALICAIPAYYLGSLVDTNITIFNLLFGSAVAGIVYVLLMLSLNVTLRVWVFDKLHSFRSK
jgi:O-antigen/teichoic acid export membrane protein